MQIILIGILAVSGYFIVLQKVLEHNRNKNAKLFTASVVLIIYSCLMVYLAIVSRMLGGINLMIYLMLILAAVICIVMDIRFVICNRKTIHVGMLILFLAYLAVIVYVTILSRESRHDMVIQMKLLNSLYLALRERSMDELNHWFLNILLFMPAGFMLPMICPEKLSAWKIVLINSLVLSTVAESLQLLLRLGHCDIDDIVANTAGGLIGFFVYRLFKSQKYL